nr:Chain A, RiLK1 [Bos taurus]
RLKWVRIWRR